MPNFTLSDFRKDLSPKYKLAPKLEKAIRDFDEEWGFKYEPKEHDLFWHPSGHCVPLASELFDLAHDRLNDVPGDLEFKRKMAKYGQVGHFWHQFLQHIMVRYEMVDASAIERQASKGINGRPWILSTLPKPYELVIGNADVAPWNYKGHDYIVDFKTMASRSFQQVTIPYDFAVKYECQMNIYMDFFDYDRALILAVNKDTPHDFKEFEYRRNQPLIDMIYAKWKFVAECLEDDERPDAEDDEAFKNLPLETV